MFGLLAQDVVEVSEKGQPALLAALLVGQLNASADDRLVGLGESLAAFRHGRARQRQECVDLERHLGCR